jgi:uncharacterized surface protein with fasciclin (FAS1) repeats
MGNRSKINFAFALLVSCALWGCSTQDNTANEMQQENATPNLNDNVNPTAKVEPDKENNLANADERNSEIKSSQKIVENLTSASKLSTLAKALQEAGLVKTLSGTGPYTVFAPTNDAFGGLPNGTLEDLMKAENKQHLANILNNHVVSGQLTAENLQDGAILKTVGGQQLKVTRRNEETMINGAKVELADKMSSNGVIHVINKVLMPAEK